MQKRYAFPITVRFQTKGFVHGSKEFEIHELPQGVDQVPPNVSKLGGVALFHTLKVFGDSDVACSITDSNN